MAPRCIPEGDAKVTRVSDYKTDTIIQTSLRNELKGDVTLITVAHRLQTIIDADKVVSCHSSPYSEKQIFINTLDGPGCRSNCEFLLSPPSDSNNKIKNKRSNLTSPVSS
jgi:hypothetical protein